MRKSSSTSPSRTPLRWKIFVLVWLIALVNFVDRSSVSVALPVIGHDLHLSPALKGWVLSAFFWTYLLFQVPGGSLIDRLGPRKIVAYGTALWGVFQALGGTVTTGGLLLLSRLGLGASEAPIMPASAKLNAHWLSPTERARGATFVDCASAVGSAIGALAIAGLITWLHSWRSAFLIAGGITVLLSVWAYRYLRDHPEQHPQISDDEAEFLRRSQTPMEAAPDTAPMSTRSYLRSRSFWAMLLGRFGWALVWWGVLTWGPQYLASTRGLNINQLGFSSFLIFGSAAVGELLAGFLADRWTRPHYRGALKWMFAVSGVVTAVSVFGLRLVSSTGAAITLLAVAVFFLNWGGLYWALPAWLAPRHHVGRVGGMMNVASSLGGIVAPIVVGYIVQITGVFDAVLLFLSSCAVVYTAGSLAVNYHRQFVARPAGETPVARSTGDPA